MTEWCLPCQRAVPLRAGLLWFNREGLGIWDLSVADAWPQPQSSAGTPDRPRLLSTLGLATTRPTAGSQDWLLRAGAFVLPRQPSVEEGGYSGHFHGNDLRSYAWSDAATVPDPVSGGDFSGNGLHLAHIVKHNVELSMAAVGEPSTALRQGWQSSSGCCASRPATRVVRYTCTVQVLTWHTGLLTDHALAWFRAAFRKDAELRPHLPIRVLAVLTSSRHICLMCRPGASAEDHLSRHGRWLCARFDSLLPRWRCAARERRGGGPPCSPAQGQPPHRRVPYGATLTPRVSVFLAYALRSGPVAKAKPIRFISVPCSCSGDASAAEHVRSNTPLMVHGIALSIAENAVTVTLLLHLLRCGPMVGSASGSGLGSIYPCI